MTGECDGREILAILDDDYARAILEATRCEPLSAKALCERCEMSRATVSRRIDTLLSHDLVAEHTRLDPDGNHYNVYEARLSGVNVRLREDGFNIRVTRREDAADRFTRLFDSMRDQ